MRKYILSAMAIVMSGMTYFGILKKESIATGLLLADVETLAQDGESETKTKCSNETFIPDEALRSAACWNGGTHLKCKGENGVCCNPKDQTDCKPLIGKKK